MKTLKLTDYEASVVLSWIAPAIEAEREQPDKRACKALESVVAKLTAVPQPKTKPVPAVKDCLLAMESVLGHGTVALPAHPDSLWFTKISASMRRQALTTDDFITMAVVLESRGWAPPYSFERTVWAADRLLAEAKDGRQKATGDFRHAPTELDEP